MSILHCGRIQKINKLESKGYWPGLRSNDLKLEFPDIVNQLNKNSMLK